MGHADMLKRNPQLGLRASGDASVGYGGCGEGWRGWLARGGGGGAWSTCLEGILWGGEREERGARLEWGDNLGAKNQKKTKNSTNQSLRRPH